MRPPLPILVLCIVAFACCIAFAMQLVLMRNPPLIHHQANGFHVNLLRQSPVTINSDYETIEHPFYGRPTSVRFSPDGAHLAMGSRETNSRDEGAWTGWLIIAESRTGKILYKEEAEQWVQSIEFSPDGKSLLVAVYSRNTSNLPFFRGFVQKDGELILFDFPSMRRKFSWKNENACHRGRFHPDGKRLLAFVSAKRPGPQTIQMIDPADGSSTILAERCSSTFIVRKEHDDLVIENEQGTNNRVLYSKPLDRWSLRIDGLHGGFIPLQSSSDGKMALVNIGDFYVYDWKRKTMVYDASWIPHGVQPSLRTWCSPDLSQAVAAITDQKRPITHPRDDIVKIDFEKRTRISLLSTTSNCECTCGDFDPNGHVAVGLTHFKGIKNDAPFEGFGHVIVFRRK